MDITQIPPELENTSTYNLIKQLLDQSQISYSELKHEPVLTSQEAANIRGETLASGAKAMLLWKKVKNVTETDTQSFILTVMSAEKKLSWKMIRKELNCKNLDMASHDQVKFVTNCLSGAVPPFGSLFKIQTYMDSSLTDQGEKINFNAGLRTQSLNMSVKDYIQLENPIILRFTE